MTEEHAKVHAEWLRLSNGGTCPLCEHTDDVALPPAIPA
jgi:hypothetical protein